MGHVPEEPVTQVVRRPVLYLLPLAFAVVALAMFTNVLPFRQLLAQRQEIATASTYLEGLSAENELLRAKVDALKSPLEIERLAREQLGYVRPGERAFVVIEPGEPAIVYPEDHPAPGPRPADPGRPWYRTVWDFVTGRDLVDSG